MHVIIAPLLRSIVIKTGNVVANFRTEMMSAQVCIFPQGWQLCSFGLEKNVVWPGFVTEDLFFVSVQSLNQVFTAGKYRPNLILMYQTQFQNLGPFQSTKMSSNFETLSVFSVTIPPKGAPSSVHCKVKEPPDWTSLLRALQE